MRAVLFASATATIAGVEAMLVVAVASALGPAGARGATVHASHKCSNYRMLRAS
jgi:hypothetical protein